MNRGQQRPGGWSMWRLLVAGLAFCLGAGLLAAQEQAPGGADGPTGAPPLVMVVDIDGAIGPASTLHLRQALSTARARNAALLVLRTDTPGGLDTAMRDMIRDILASPVPVATYVAPAGARAASAGTYILYASHLAAMSPGTNLGAATPVQMGGEPQPLPGGGQPAEDATSGEQAAEDDAGGTGDAMTAKAVNDAVAYIRGLAELHGRNPDWAERAVRRAESLSAGAALAQQVIEIVATDLDDLLAQADGRSIRLGAGQATLATAGAAVEQVDADWRVRILAVITDPNIAYILMLIGIYGILYEFISPGTIFSGVIGTIALLTALFALNLLPISFAGIGLLLFGIALMVGEAFAPSFGILGIGGMVAFALGSLMLFDDVPGFELSLPLIVITTAVSLLLLVVVVAAGLRAHRRRVASGDPAETGSLGQVVHWSGSTGEVHSQGERWQARLARPGPAPLPGTAVRVTGRDGLRLLVEPIAPADPAGDPPAPHPAPRG